MTTRTLWHHYRSPFADPVHSPSPDREARGSRPAGFREGSKQRGTSRPKAFKPGCQGRQHGPSNIIGLGATPHDFEPGGSRAERGFPLGSQDCPVFRLMIRTDDRLEPSKTRAVCGAKGGAPTTVNRTVRPDQAAGSGSTPAGTDTGSAGQSMAFGLPPFNGLWASRRGPPESFRLSSTPARRLSPAQWDPFGSRHEYRDNRHGAP